jgi:putative copper resistance protein D
MIEAGVVVLRWVQFLSATAALGLPLFVLYAPASLRPGAGSMRRLVLASIAVLALSAGAGLLLQTAMMAGAASGALDPTAVAYVAQSTELGGAHIASAGLALAAALVLIVGRGGVAARWIAVALLSGAVAPFAGGGHGA